MRRIEPTNAFKRDYRREAKGKYRQALQNDFVDVVRWLAADEPLIARHRDHSPSGEWNDHRDCHIKPDLVLIYRKPDATTLQLVRLEGAMRNWACKGVRTQTYCHTSEP